MQKKEFLMYGKISIGASYLLLLCAFYVLNQYSKTPINYVQQRAVVGPRKSIPSLALKQSPSRRIDSPGRKRVISRASKGKIQAARHEGTLWIDRKMFRCLISLGTTDGLTEGVLVDIFDGKKRVGEARVIQLFDGISYAELVGKDQEEYKKNYYRVSIP